MAYLALFFVGICISDAAAKGLLAQCAASRTAPPHAPPPAPRRCPPVRSALPAGTGDAATCRPRPRRARPATPSAGAGRPRTAWPWLGAWGAAGEVRAGENHVEARARLCVCTRTHNLLHQTRMRCGNWVMRMRPQPPRSIPKMPIPSKPVRGASGSLMRRRMRSGPTGRAVPTNQRGTLKVVYV